MNTALKIILAVFLGAVLLFALIIFLLMQLLGGTLFRTDPETPEIQYGEFPFKLVYELNGEEITIEDTLICEYDGIGNPAFAFSIGMGVRKWKSYLASDKEEDCPLLLELEDGTRIYYATDRPDYYMGDGGKSESVNDPFNSVFAKGPRRSELHHMGSAKMLEYLNIALIEWEIAPPIVNEFK